MIEFFKPDPELGFRVCEVCGRIGQWEKDIGSGHGWICRCGHWIDLKW